MIVKLFSTMKNDIAMEAQPESAQKSRSIKRLISALVLVPPAVFICYEGLSFVQDSLFGDELILALKAQSRRRLWDLFWADWAHALPALYLACLLLMVPAYFASGALGRRRPIVTGLIGALCGAVAGSWLHGSFTLGAVSVPLLTGLISFSAFAVIASSGAASRS